jgi:phage antirepressor YoqD-like protein
LGGHGAKFGRKQEEAVAALLTQRNIDEAAKSIGIAPNTLLKWMEQPEFLTAYRVARRDAYRQAIARLQQGTSAAAATTLLKTMIDPSTPASVKGLTLLALEIIGAYTLISGHHF